MRQKDDLEKYVAKNAEMWYAFVNVKLKIDAPSGSLYLVTGCDKAPSWEVASFYNPSYRRQEFTLQMQAACACSASASISRTTVIDASVYRRRSTGTQATANQAVFLRGLKIGIRSGPKARILSPVKVQSFDEMPYKSIMSKGRSPYLSRSGSSSSISSSSSVSSSSGGTCALLLLLIPTLHH
jgi:hypothetical protein